ncbi:F-box only protein 15 isoform X1 [Gasterosteus aculeatus]
MATGRGPFFQSFLEGLRRNRAEPNCGPTAPAARQSRATPSPTGSESGPRADGPTAGKRQPSGGRWTPPRIKEYETYLTPMVTSQSDDNFMERLPPEILLKILSYLDASALFCISHVDKTFHQLAADDEIWRKIYVSDFGSQSWRPKPAAPGVDWKADSAAARRPAGHWKKAYFRTVGQEVNKWRSEMRDVDPHSGLPRSTQRVLRSLKVGWQLTLTCCSGREMTVEPSRAHFCQSSAIIFFGDGRFPRLGQIQSLRLYGVRTARSVRAGRPGWRSLILQLDARTRGCFFGRDELVTLRRLQPAVTVATWRGEDTVAFVMVTLHLHKLLERSLLGSPVCPYSEPLGSPPVGESDPEVGLRGYSLHFVLHNTGSEIMAGNFRQLCCRPGGIQRGLLELRVISRSDVSQHRSLSGAIELPWRSEALQGSVENCCVMTLTLLDDSQKPRWCVSSSVAVVGATGPPALDYAGEHFVMCHCDPGGQVTMRLVRLTEQRQFLVVDLVVRVPAAGRH